MQEELTTSTTAAEYNPRIQLIVVNASGERFELRIVDLSQRHIYEQTRPLNPSQLIELCGASESTPSGWESKINPCSALESLGCSVHRPNDEFGLVRGQVSALRGLVLLEVDGLTVGMKGLVEVTFDSTEPLSGQALPPLSASDRGRLVSTWDHRPIGLLVGGVGHVGCVLPIQDFLVENSLNLLVYKEIRDGLTADLGSMARAPGLIDDGLAALTGELSREMKTPAEPADLWQDAAA